MLEAIVAGVIAQVLGSIVASIVQRKRDASRSAIEYVPETRTVTVHQSLVRFGPITYQRTTSEMRIEGASFKLDLADKSIRHRSAPFLIGLAFGAVIFAIALLV